MNVIDIITKFCTQNSKEIIANVTQINTVKYMKEQILKVAQDLEKGTIDSDKAYKLYVDDDEVSQIYLGFHF